MNNNTILLFGDEVAYVETDFHFESLQYGRRVTSIIYILLANTQEIKILDCGWYYHTWKYKQSIQICLN